VSGGSAGRLQDRRRRGVAGAARTGEVRPAPPGRWRLRRSRLRGADGSSACLRGAGGSDSAAVAAVLAICAANCRGLARPLLRSWGRDGPGAGAGRRAPAGRKGPTLARGDPPDLRRRREWLADRENRPQDRLGIVGGWWGGCRGGSGLRAVWEGLQGGYGTMPMRFLREFKGLCQNYAVTRTMYRET